MLYECSNDLKVLSDHQPFFIGYVDMKWVGNTKQGYPVYQGKTDMLLKQEWKDEGLKKQKKNEQKYFALVADFDDEHMQRKEKGHETKVNSNLVTILYQGDDEDIQLLAAYNEQMVKVMEVVKKAKGIEPCRYTAIGVLAPKAFNYLLEKEDALYDLTDQEIQIVAGATEKSACKVVVQLKDLKLQSPDGVRCIAKPAPHEAFKCDLKTEVQAITNYRAHDVGVYLKPNVHFDGLKISIEFKASFKLKSSKSLVPDIESEGSWELPEYVIIEEDDILLNRHYIIQN